jgi:hypothetical protein
MKVKALATLLALFFIAVLVLPVPVHAESLTLETTQGIVGAAIKVPAFCQYGEGEYFLYFGDSNQLISQGTVKVGNCQPITFIVPQSPRGKQMVTLKVGAKTFQKEFTVLASISLGIKKGTVSSSVSVEGKGFDKQETGIKVLFDGNTVASGIEANPSGSWLYTLKVPAASKGNHLITASGTTTPVAEAGNQVYNVTPSITANPASGWVGRMVNVSGWGFGAAETNITVIYDDTVVKSNATADLNGGWQTNFSVPASSKGAHKIDAKGATTSVDDVPDAQFIVAPGIKVEQATGRLGDVINAGDTLFVTGVGFKENETNIKVTFDSMQVAEGIAADAHGSWSGQFPVPPSTKGEHTVNSFGDATGVSDVTGYTVVITPEVAINPTSGAIGENTLLSGTGFGANQPLTIVYDSKKVATGAVTDPKGSFSTTFKPPISGAGTHLVAISDGTQATGSASFTIESNPPATPSPISPEPGTKLSLFDNKPIDFRWSVVEDPSGVVYSLEMSMKSDFSGSVIRKEGLDKPIYSLPVQERPGSGEYFWRVKAVDLAGNTSGWSQSQLILITGFDFLWIVVAAIVVLAVIGLVIWRVRAVSKKGGWSSPS